MPWGEGLSANLLAPSAALDDEFVQRWARFERISSSPGMARAIMRMVAQLDARDVLPNVAVPTLVLHRVGDQTIPVEDGQVYGGANPGRQIRRAAG